MAELIKTSQLSKGIYVTNPNRGPGSILSYVDVDELYSDFAYRLINKKKAQKKDRRSGLPCMHSYILLHIIKHISVFISYDEAVSVYHLVTAWKHRFLPAYFVALLLGL